MDPFEQDMERQLYQDALDGEREALRRADEAEEQAQKLQAMLSSILAQMSPNQSQDSHEQTANMIQTMLRRPGTIELEAVLAGLGGAQPSAPHHAKPTAGDTHQEAQAEPDPNLQATAPAPADKAALPKAAAPAQHTKLAVKEEAADAPGQNCSCFGRRENPGGVGRDGREGQDS